jgi:hypothetical protein
MRKGRCGDGRILALRRRHMPIFDVIALYGLSEQFLEMAHDQNRWCRLWKWDS